MWKKKFAQKLRCNSETLDIRAIVRTERQQTLARGLSKAVVLSDLSDVNPEVTAFLEVEHLGLTWSYVRYHGTRVFEIGLSGPFLT